MSLLCCSILRGGKVQGGSLFYALAISVIIAMITCSILLAEHFTRISLVNDITDEEVIRNAESGIILACTDNENDYSEGSDLDLFGRGKDSVFVQRKSWGAFDIFISQAHTLNTSFEKIALIGCKESPDKNYALWLADMDRPLSITGATELRGKCYLPKSGVERAYIEGNSYQGSQLVYGEMNPSSRFTPLPSKNRLSLIERLLKGETHEDDSLVSWNDMQLLDTLNRSFKDNAIVVKERLPIRIHQNIHGQVCIISSVSIFVSNTSGLTNVLLVAPRIEIEEKTEGQFQAIARDSLIVGKDVHLDYPSALVVCADKSSPEFAGLVIQEQAKIMGDVFGYIPENDVRRHMTVSIERDAMIYGSVYCNDLVDMKATVIGSVICSKFVLKTNSAVYENHLMDAVINRSKRNEAYAGSFLCADEKSIKSVAQWLE